MRKQRKRLAVALAATAAVIAPLAVAANATVVTPSTPRDGSLVQVGPIADNGFPTWYRDSNGIRLELCYTLDDPNCTTLPDEVPNPDQPISFPDNFPGESFYQLASAQFTPATVGDLRVDMNLEAAFGAGAVKDGDQVVFGRMRIRAKTAPNGTYRITHPYGIDEFTTTGGTGINTTEDIGLAPGAFGGALNSRIGPYLTWDTFTPGDTTPGGPGEPPAGYVGQPGTLHAVKGSPYGTNFVKVERKAADGSWQTLGQTNLFDVQGRLARNDGVDVQQATYSTASDGTKVVEVFATSEAGEAIRMVAPTLGYKGITLEEDNFEVVTSPTSSHQEGRYYGRFAVKDGVTVTGGADATKIVIQNAGDVPVTNKTVALSDVVTVAKAAYDGSKLTVNATSSDPAATLSVVGYGDLTDGTAVFDGVDAPPHVITVRSSEGGTATVPLTTSGPFNEPDAPVAVATVTPTRPLANQTVTLDASGSLDATSYEWVAPAKVTVDGPLNASTLRFTAPTGLYEFALVAIGETGNRSKVLTIPVRVTQATTVSARAGAAQTVLRGSNVTLDGSASIGAETYQWEQIPNVEGQEFTPVTLSGASTPKPTFTLPLMALPAAPGPNNTYTAVAATPLRFRLTVTGNGGETSTAETVVRPQAEALAVTEARYRTRGEWRLSGTSDLKAGQRVAVVLGSRVNASGLPTLASARGQVIGFATVDTLGAWTYVGTGPDPRTTTATTVTAVSTLGGQTIGNITITS
jgi:hypothetical protein